MVKEHHIHMADLVKKPRRKAIFGLTHSVSDIPLCLAPTAFRASKKGSIAYSIDS